MTDFTTILNRGIRRHIDKNMKTRKFGKCDGCDKPALLIAYQESKTLLTDKDGNLYLCEFCYTEILNSEID